MKDINDWKNSAITLMGDKSKRRKTVMAAITLGLAGILSYNAITMPLTQSVDASLQSAGGIEHSQLVNHMDPVGQKLNAMYGSKTNVIVYHDDANLALILANAKDGIFEKSSSVAFTSYFRDAITTIKEKVGIEVDKGEVSRNNSYDDMRSELIGPYVNSTFKTTHGMYDQAQTTNLLKGWGTMDLQKLERNYPYFESGREQNPSDFFHEMTHAVDNKDDRPTYETQNENVMNSEAIADMGQALIALKYTGNLDTWYFNAKTQRLTNATDVSHETVEIVDRALIGIDQDTVKNMSDREVMLYAKDRVNNTIDDMMQKTHTSPRGVKYSDWETNQYTHTGYTSKLLNEPNIQNKHDRWLNKLTGNKANEYVMNFSRAAMESSINNMAYHGKLEVTSPEFVRSVVEHAERFNDTKAGDALKTSMAGDHFDYRGFSDKMGFKVDFDAGARREANTEIMANYFTSITNRDANIGFEETIIPAINMNAVGIFALKTEKVIGEAAQKLRTTFSFEK
ncbi:hypothetical protein RYA05_01650 [Pseudomonas syringae pv. actinidiae]|nr:hypothetical protein [Pseudomonas syringae pv. actinidiae]